MLTYLMRSADTGLDIILDSGEPNVAGLELEDAAAFIAAITMLLMQ